MYEMRTGAEALGLGVTQVSLVERIEKVCKKEKESAIDSSDGNAV